MKHMKGNIRMKVFGPLALALVASTFKPVTAEALSPGALIKKCGQVTKELERLVQTTKNTNPLDLGDLLELQRQGKKVQTQHKSFRQDLEDSTPRFIEEATPEDLAKLKRCISRNGSLQKPLTQQGARIEESAAAEHSKIKSKLRPSKSSAPHPPRPRPSHPEL
jgi:hypothetical protein